MTARSAALRDHSIAQQALGNAVHLFRERRSLTVESVADSIDMHPRYLAAIERGEMNPAFKTLRDIAQGLAIPVSELFAAAERIQEAEATTSPIVAFEVAIPVRAANGVPLVVALGLVGRTGSSIIVRDDVSEPLRLETAAVLDLAHACDDSEIVTLDHVLVTASALVGALAALGAGT